MEKIKKGKRIKKIKKCYFVFEVTFPKNKSQLINAKKVFQRTQDALNNFYETYKDGTKGAPSHQKQDLLRAMIIFACAGLDSFLKQLISDCLADIINCDEGAYENFKNFVEKKLKNKNYSSRFALKRQDADDPLLDFNYSFLSSCLCSNEPQKIILEEYKKSFSGSLQSEEEVFRVGAAFAIQSSDILAGTAINQFQEIFKARNNIAHELDIAFEDKSKWDTRKRTSKEILVMCRLILTIMQTLLEKLDSKLYANQ